jgi:hypothetical protein
MLVRDHPPSVNLAEANRRPPPHIEFSSVCPRCANMAEAVRERHVIARGDAEIANLVADRTLERREPLLRPFLRRIRSRPLEWADDVERLDVGGQIRN